MEQATVFLSHIFSHTDKSVIQGRLSKLHLRTFFIGKYLLVASKRIR